MTGPTDPEDPDDSGDWSFPEVAGPEPAGPASVDLPAMDEGQQHDTGSDAWWRAQAEAQRRAAQYDPVVPPAAAPAPATEPPPDLVEPEVLQPGPPTAAYNPLDRDWLPPELAEPTGAYAGEPEAAVPEPPTEPEPMPEPQPAYAAPESPATRPPHEPARVGPARAVAGAALAIAGVAMGIGALLWAGSDEPEGASIVSSLATESSTPSPTATPTPSPSQMASPTPSLAGQPTPVATTPVAEPPQAPIVAVSVLNNSRIKGLADRAATRFRAGGWPVPVTGNYRGGIIATTTVYFAPGQQASAQRFAKQFGIPRVAPRFSGLPTRGMTVVLTRDYH